MSKPLIDTLPDEPEQAERLKGFMQMTSEQKHEYRGYKIKGEIQPVMIDGHPGNTVPQMVWKFDHSWGMAFASQIVGGTLDDVKRAIDERKGR